MPVGDRPLFYDICWLVRDRVGNTKTIEAEMQVPAGGTGAPHLTGPCNISRQGRDDGCGRTVDNREPMSTRSGTESALAPRPGPAARNPRMSTATGAVAGRVGEPAQYMGVNIACFRTNYVYLNHSGCANLAAHQSQCETVAEAGIVPPAADVGKRVLYSTSTTERPVDVRIHASIPPGCHDSPRDGWMNGS